MATEKETAAASREGLPAEGREPGLDGWLRRQAWLEPWSDFTQRVVGAFYGALGRPGRTLRDLVHGVWPLGHPLHPALTDIPVGAWVTAVVLGYVSYFWTAVPPAAAPAVLAVGVVAGLAAAVAGYTDFYTTFGLERRTGMLHGLTMTLTILVMIVSLVVWVWSPGARGAALGIATAGLATALFGAYVGGHLTFRFGTMVNRNAFTEFPEAWADVGTPEDFAEGKLNLVHVAGIPVLVVRRDGVLRAMANTCTHAGGPLNEGTLDGNIVTCPWHGSRFCIRDGKVRGGPATFAEHVFMVREESGRIQLRSAHIN